MAREYAPGRYELKGSAFTSPFLRCTPFTFNDASAGMLDDDTGFRCLASVESIRELSKGRQKVPTGRLTVVSSHVEPATFRLSAARFLAVSCRTRLSITTVQSRIRLRRLLYFAAVRTLASLPLACFVALRARALEGRGALTLRLPTLPSVGAASSPRRIQRDGTRPYGPRGIPTGQASCTTSAVSGSKASGARNRV
ncbi:hypothetical protein Raf01_63840 [Rugosimonospora africana]|uniref:Uncharacterized protein n=1 Tax=Rugosimonospora africana TaxID=556532 RepID=A0A8J3QY27_9ACTN|nr:hypothetical protein Raf01_63840 [Rugosimonospora africana]